MTDTFLTLEKKVQLKPYIPRAFKSIELMTDQEIVSGAGGTLIVDTESYDNYFLVAFKCIKTGKYIQMEAPFNERMLSWIMHSYRTVGFNSNSYDLPMIWAAYQNQDTHRLQSVSWRLVQGNQTREVLKEFGFLLHKTNHIDIIDVCPHHGSLKLYGGRIHSPRIQDLPFDLGALEDWQIPVVKDYNINDLDETERLFVFMKDRFELRHHLSMEYRDDLMSKSDAQIAETVINKEVRALTGKWPRRTEIDPGTIFYYNVPSYLRYQTPVLQKMLEVVRNAKFVVGGYGVGLPKELEDYTIPLGRSHYRMGVGGLHSSEKNISYKSTEVSSIVDRDVASYYPAIILNQGLYPEGMGQNFLTVYKNIVTRRLAAKKAKNFTTDKGLKVTINGTFGKTNSIWSTLYSPQMFIQIVLTGQLSLLMLIEMLEIAGMQVVSANTDGVVFLVHKQYDLDGTYEQVVKQWEAVTGFTTEETRYSDYYARDVNAYFAVKMDGSVKVKGPYSEVGSTSGTPLDNNPASLICSDAIKLLLGKGIPIEKTIYECQDIRRFVTVRNVKRGAHKDGYYLGKVVRWYYAKNTAGTINYILSGNKVPDTEGAYPCMDLPINFPTNLDYQWYVNKTNEILTDIAYHPRKEQLRFF